MGGLIYTPEQELDEFVSFYEQGGYMFIVQQEVQVLVGCLSRLTDTFYKYEPSMPRHAAAAKIERRE